MKKFISFLLLCLFIVACSTNPVTGKNNLILVSNAQLFPMAFQQYEKTLNTVPVSNNKEQTQMIKTVGHNIKNAVEAYLKQTGNSDFLNGYAWEFNLLKDDKQINAWCMPGGKVAFYTGIMPICESEDGVAVVMGHEITHALAEHSAQRASKAMIAQGLQVAGNVAINDPRYRGAFNQLYPIGSGISMLAFSRSDELEADRVGLRLMAMAGYDPREAPRFWKRMQEATKGGQRPPEFLSTHPNPGRRIEQLEALVPEVLPLYYKAIGKNK